MNFIFILSIAFALALDAFSVSVAAAAYLGKLTGRQKFRLSFHFGLFQFMMPLFGWFAGSTIVHYIEQYDHWIAFLLLSIIGIKMIVDARHAEINKISTDITKGFSLISLSLATSIDALAVGFSIGVIKGEILFPAIVIGLIAAVMTLLGIRIGVFLSSKFGHRISIVGGIVLIIIGIHILYKHLKP